MKRKETGEERRARLETPRKHVKAKHLEKTSAKEQAKAKVEQHMYPDTSNVKTSDTAKLNELTDNILGSHMMTNPDLWVDLRGPIRKVIAGGYDRAALDKQLKLTRVRYNELVQEEKKPKLTRSPVIIVDATTMETGTGTTAHPAADYEESSSSVPTDRSHALEPKGPTVDPERPPSPVGLGGDRDDPAGAFENLFDLTKEREQVSDIAEAGPIVLTMEEPAPFAIDTALAEFSAGLTTPRGSKKKERAESRKAQLVVRRREQKEKKLTMEQARADYTEAHRQLKEYGEGTKRNPAEFRKLQGAVDRAGEAVDRKREEYEATVPFADSRSKSKSSKRDRSPDRNPENVSDASTAESISYTPKTRTTLMPKAGRTFQKRKRLAAIQKRPKEEEKQMGKVDWGGMGFGAVTMQVAVGQEDIVDHSFAIAQGYMTSVVKNMSLKSNLPASLAPVISNNPVRPTMSRSFGSTLSKPRRIAIPGGVITAVRGQTVIQCNRKSPNTVTQVTAFLQTNFPYGGKIGGVMYSLVALIPRVLKGLPGSVTINT